MDTLLDRLFAHCEQTGASDIHLSVGQPPRFRLEGALHAEAGFPATTADDLRAPLRTLVRTTLPDDAPDAAVDARLAASKALDGALTSKGGFRYRFNLFREANGPAVALRRLDGSFRTLEELGLPARLADFCTFHDGLVLVTGPTGSGKSTTLATLLDTINRTRYGHLVTIEDPVEYVHHSDRCLVRQRQVGRDADSFHDALVEALRQDPDVILVGEIRDLETIRTAVIAAETGHLVFATLHAGDCAGAIERLVSVFPADEQDGIRHQLSLVLRGIFAQHLLPSAVPGGRRVPACELLFSTPAVANLVATGRSAQLYTVLETSGAQGMLSLDQSLAEHCRAGRLSPETALAFSKNPSVLRERLRPARQGGSRV